MRISRRAAIRALVLLLFPFLGAAAQVQGDRIPGVAGYGVELGLDGSGNVGALLVYQGTQLAQTLLACTPQAVAPGPSTPVSKALRTEPGWR